MRPGEGPPVADQLGFGGLLLAGYSPEDAWAEVRRTSASPEVQAIIDSLGATEDGRAALDWSRRQWAKRGFPAPWDLG